MAKQRWKKVGDRKAGGKITGAVIMNVDSGEQKTLLNPHGKYKKYSVELSENKAFTNDGQVKKDKSGRPQTLSKGQKAYRAGYRSAIIDQTKAYNGKKR